MIRFLDSRPAAVEITYSVKDHFRNSKRNMVKTIVFSSEATHGPVSVSTALQDVDIVAQIISPSGQRRAILRSPKSGSPRYVEIWKNGLLETSLDVTDLHGDFYFDGECKWSMHGSTNTLVRLKTIRVPWIALFLAIRNHRSVYSGS